MERKDLSVPVKLWALVCALVGTALAGSAAGVCALTLIGFAYLAFQRNWRFLRSFGMFYAALALLLYLIRFHALCMVVFSEFYVLMFWKLSPVLIVGWDLVVTPPGELSAFLSRLRTPTPVILGLLVMFRFFPIMKAELRGVVRSMRNRGLTAPLQIVCHPMASCEYVLVPMLLRCVQIADQLSVSAVARGGECPGIRGSYYGRSLNSHDTAWTAVWAMGVAALLLWGGRMQ